MRRTESVVAAEFAKAEAEHTAAVEQMQALANRRTKLRRELEAIRSGKVSNEVEEKPVVVDSPVSE